MILLLQIFDEILGKLKELKENNKIQKFSIKISLSNTIQVVLIGNNPIEKIQLTNNDFELIQLSLEELEEDIYYSELFENTSDEIVNYKTTRRKLTNLLNAENDYVSKTPIITYYSYKGGMGRSTNLVLTATHLARQHQKKIVIIDCDFEAPGFTNFFLENPSAPSNKNGLIEYFFDIDIDSSINLNNYSWEVSKEYSKDGEIRIIPAGNLGVEYIGNNTFNTDLKQYLEGLSRLDFSSTEYIVDKFKNLIADIETQFQPDMIFIDSRTGFTDIFGIVALKLASFVVGLFSNSVQNLPGIYQFIDSIKIIPNLKSEFRPLIINAFSDSKFFKEFKDNINSYIQNNSKEDNEISSLAPDYFYFRYNPTLAEIGTSREEKQDWISAIDSDGITGYTDVAERINSFVNEYMSSLNEFEEHSDKIHSNITCKIEAKSENKDIQKEILMSLKNNWPELYGDSESLDFESENKEGKFFFRDSMKDLFNFSKFLILGNKGTGKSYLFQALKNKEIVEELKKKAQKTTLNIEFLHLVDKKNNYFINTNGLESFNQQIDEIGDFYAKFWKVYTWKAIIEKLDSNHGFKSKIIQSFNINNDDTKNLQSIVNFISSIDNIINVEDELKELDKILNSKQLDLVVIYDNLDIMVQPNKWKDQMASLVNFWAYSNYKRIHGKLFLRSDLFKKIRGLNNSQELINKSISIEWTKEEIFNYFFNLVRLFAKENFIDILESFDFKKINSDDIAWKDKFIKELKKEKQVNEEEYILRRLCWVFFGQYPDIKAHGESYDWLYKNVMNADETISLRPFIDLISLSVGEYEKDIDKDKSAVLPKTYYTRKGVRTDAVKNHFNDLAKDKGNESLLNIFDYLDKNQEYQFYELPRKVFYELLQKVILQYKLTETTDELVDLLIINGIIKEIGNFKYQFAFLYKYRLGLRNWNKGRSYKK